jgi:hypothetical protein|tara:strand:- start:3935 stop:4810 length:876 start_codon:yes stop_codon:yes gene_type:complete
MSRGFLLLGIDTDEDKIKYAYTAALSIKACDPDASVCLIVEDIEKDLRPGYDHVFDYIVELPFGNTAYKDGFHGTNIWQIRECTPYDESIYVDYDTIFLNTDIDQLWDTLSSYDVAMPGYARTFRNTPLSTNSLFEFEKHYNFPTLYSNFIYFKTTSKLAIEWFKMADPVFQNWREVYVALMNDKKPISFNKNVLCNITTQLLDVGKDISININNLYDLDTHSQNLWSKDIPIKWTELLNYWFPENKKLIIENSIISSGIVHYRDEDFITEEIINEYNTNADISSRRKTAS